MPKLRRPVGTRVGQSIETLLDGAWVASINHKEALVES